MTKRDIYGHTDYNPRHDLLSVILIGLNKDAGQGEGSELHQLLSTLFSSKLMPEEKEAILKEQFQFPPSADRREVLDEMCNLSSGIWKDGLEKGRKEGLEEGMEKGIAGIVSICKEVGMSFSQAVSRVLNYMPTLSAEKAEAQVKALW